MGTQLTQFQLVTVKICSRLLTTRVTASRKYLFSFSTTMGCGTVHSYWPLHGSTLAYSYLIIYSFMYLIIYLGLFILLLFYAVFKNISLIQWRPILWWEVAGKPSHVRTERKSPCGRLQLTAPIWERLLDHNALTNWPFMLAQAGERSYATYKLL